MDICMNQLIRALGTALDAVECEIFGVSTNHGKRVAKLAIAMGKNMGMSDDELSSIASCALLHDNALTEYILSERPGAGQHMNMRLHCEYGQRNADALPFRSSVEGLILYHHERANGTGPFAKKEDEYPLGAAIIAIADMVDVQVHLQRVMPEKLPAIKKQIQAQTGRMYTQKASGALLEVLDENMLFCLKDENIRQSLADAMPQWTVHVASQEVVRLAGITAQIIDYKSNFTRKHSVQIANKAWLMCEYYDLPGDAQSQVYLAASMHDLGKLFIPTDILEKPGKLTDDEFKTIKNHAWWTKELLREISGFKELCAWASNHHEKLDGTGYPSGLTANNLDFLSRLLTCVDIYQAVTEERPYHRQRTHEEGMAILNSLVAAGKVDSAIAAAIDIAMAPYSERDVPAPPGAVV